MGIQLRQLAAKPAIDCAQEFANPPAADRRERVTPQDLDKPWRRTPDGALNMVGTNTGSVTCSKFGGSGCVGGRAKNVPDLSRSSQRMKISRG
ncbi:hypothetical protein XH79_01220 [Bradyrhizobium sp. CCBAU 45389]|nr:hypothetical protein [Bradyrhizobium sp. CCBAU 45389]